MGIMSIKLFAFCHADASQLVKTLAAACYSCILPIRVGGIPVIQGSMPDQPKGSVQSLCTCPAPPPIFTRIGVSMGYFEPNKMIDVVKDPYCFPSFGFNLGGHPMIRGTKGDAVDRTRTFFQAHYMEYPLLSMTGLFTDSLCFYGKGADLAYMTETDPLWNDDQLAAIINPEAILFGNPVTNLACIADSVSSMHNRPLDSLFWCKGSWGNTYPLTGSTNTKDYVEASASVASGLIYKLHRQGVAWATWGNLCSPIPLPIWTKSAYRLQIISPVPHPTATGIGQSELLWSYGKNPPYVGDNFSYLIFKQKECCSF